MKLQSIILLSTFVVLSSCTREAPDMSRVSLQVPKTDALFAKGLQISSKVEIQSDAMSKWALPAPQNFNEINCFAVMVHVPDMDAEVNSCKTFEANPIATAQIIKGGFLQNTNQMVEVPTGMGRTIYLVGFYTEDEASCIDLAGNTAAERFHSDKFSPPMILSQKVVDLQGGDVSVDLSVPSTLTDSMKFEDCEPALFSKDVAPSEPTALISSVAAVNSLTNITFSVSGSYVYEYSYALVNAAGSCSGATWSNFVPVATPITVGAGVDGSYTYCVKAKSASGKEQTNPTMVTWQRDTQVPGAIPQISLASAVGNNSTPFLTVTSWPATDAAKIEIYTGIGCTGLLTTKTKAEAETGLILSLTTDAQYNFYARYVDAANNAGSCTATGASYILDRQGPSVPAALSARIGTSLEYTPYFTWGDATDAGLAGIDRYQVAYSDGSIAFDQLSWASAGIFYSTYMQVSPFFEEVKDYYFSVRAIDKAGNFGDISTQKFRVNLSAQWSQQAFIKAKDAAVEDRFGNAVAIDADTMVVGSDENDIYNSGAVYIYKRSGNTWAEVEKLEAPDKAYDDGFGYAVAISGDTIVVGAPDEDSAFNSVQNAPVTGFTTGATNSGAVYVFRKVNDQWKPEAYIKAPANMAYGHFGGSVAIVGNTIVVGAKNTYTAGSAFVYERAGSQWGFRQTLLPYDPGDTDTDHAFGSAVSFDGLRIAVGAPGKASSEGAVYIYSYQDNMWSFQQKVQAGLRSSYDRFGASLQIFGKRLVVGAPGEDSSQNSVSKSLTLNDSAADSGAAYIFETDMLGDFQLDSYLKSPSNWGGYEEFGTSVALFGTTVVVAAPYEDNCAHQQLQSVTSTVQQEYYGSCLNSGAVYVYQQGADKNWKWSTYAKPTFNDSQIQAKFGYSVAISGSSIAVGAPFESSDTKSVLNGTVADSSFQIYNSNSGAVYLLDVYDSVPQDPQILPAPASQGPPPIEITPIDDAVI